MLLLVDACRDRGCRRRCASRGRSRGRAVARQLAGCQAARCVLAGGADGGQAGVCEHSWRLHIHLPLDGWRHEGIHQALAAAAQAARLRPRRRALAPQPALAATEGEEAKHRHQHCGHRVRRGAVMLVGLASE